MFSLRTLGFGLACLVTAAAVLGAGLLIALDFAGADGLAHAWSGLASARAAENSAPVNPAPPDPLAGRLKDVGEIDLFVTVEVPGSPVRISTGTAYANAHDLAQGTPSSRWCYARREAPNSAFQPTVTLGNQKGAQTPILFQAASLAAEEARQVGLTPDVLADLSRRLCRFGA